ncbi:hypothetical protein EV363DRAFT_1584042 [Boletus edulis]|nr:hypothetical protein EV363DRAFT_1584042 [Boletus edulis]
MWQSRQDYAPVAIDTRALIDKVLARYSGEFTVFRELLQNSDDAGCDTAEIRFETSARLCLDPKGTMNAGPAMFPDLTATHVTQWTFRNHGKPFTSQDWSRLPKIAMGNPDPQKVGAFGVGFYTVFSVTESPYVSSGDKEMEFLWNDENQLNYRFGDLPQAVARDLWTTFKMPLREATPMPPLSELMQFLASSITFMAHLEELTIFFDHHCLGQIKKSLRQSLAIPIPVELDRWSLGKIMYVKSIHQHPVTIKAGIWLPQHGSMRAHETKVDLTVFTAEVDVTVDEKLTQELNRCTKKNPPSRVKYSLIYTGKDEYDQSGINERKHACEFPSSFRGLRADLDGAANARLFIGHSTAQTTGIGGHMASHFIPTVERESIDLVEKSVATWNRELLHVGGFLCRVVYELELSEIQGLWGGATAGEPHSYPSRELQDQLQKRFLHVLKFFTFHRSTPLSKVAELLTGSFYGCSTLPLRLLSFVGVRGAPDVRAFDPVLVKFLKSLPMLSEYVTRDGAHSIAKLPDKHKIPAIRLSDILQDLRRHTLGAEELVACLRWWINARQDYSASDTADLLDAATICGAGGVVRLSSITCFINPNVLGLHIPPDGPLPLSLIPLDVSKSFDCEELTSFGLEEFTVVSWLQHISRPDVMSADEKYDFTRSTDWASRVLSALSRVWPQLPEDMQSEARKVFRNKPCIPTSKGLCCPECSYLTEDNAPFPHLDLPIVSCNSRFRVDMKIKRCLLFIGVRKNPPVEFLLHQMSSTEGWTVSDLVNYLIQEESSLTSEDHSALKSSKIFTREGFHNEEEENTRHRADELYPPVLIFRRLRLPVIKWSEKSEWSDTSSEARLLYHLGLNRFPSLSQIMELCSSKDNEVQETAFKCLYSGLRSRYQDYNPEDFRDAKFIPAENDSGRYLKKLGEVYSGTQWRALGFFVVQDRYPSVPWDQLGVRQHPPVSKILDLLEETPPRNRETARRWFEILYHHLSTFSPPDLTKLSGLPIVPTGSSNTPILLPPTKCYLDQGPKPPLHAKLFSFVNFSAKANYFLGACGLKNRVSIEDIAEVLIENPERFFKLAGGHEGFLVELRKIAYQSQDISNDTLHKMSCRPTLLGVCRKKTEGQPRWDYEHRFLAAQDVTIVDDVNDYQLFSDCLFIAPQEEALERFYASLGCSYLSTVVQERCHGLHEMQDTKTCLEVQSRILERLPLFIQKYTDSKPEAMLPSSSDHLKVKACKRIHVSKTLATRNVERTRDAWAIARHKGGHIELWVSKTAKRDMYEVATCLCRLLFGTNKMNATLLLETVLSADLKVLEKRGFLIDQISKNHGDGYAEARQKCLAGSASATDSSQQSTLDTQPGPQLDCETLSGSSGTTPQFLSLNAADRALPKTSGASNISSDRSLAAIEHPAPVLLSRTAIPQSYIRSNVEKAIEACGSGGEISAVHAQVGQLLSSNFCMVSAAVGRLRSIGQVNNIQVYVNEDMPDADKFMTHMCGPLARFADIIIALSKIYRISTTRLCIFYDISGGCIAFNCQGVIYLNLRYFELWHDEQVKSGDRQNAQMWWFLTLAHEIAHNLTELHNSDHEFWFSAICEAHLAAFSQLLRPANNTWLHYVPWLMHMVVIIFFAYLAKHIQ